MWPQHFLLLATLANVGKSIGLATALATTPAFNKSFARTENMADVTAKLQAQKVLADNLGPHPSASLAPFHPSAPCPAPHGSSLRPRQPGG